MHDGSYRLFLSMVAARGFSEGFARGSAVSIG